LDAVFHDIFDQLMQTSCSRSRSPTASSANKIAIVAGATGQTGKQIVKELVLQGYEVRAGVRGIAKAQEALPKDENLEFVSFSLPF
jgi:lysine/ornithine N-monooxygenase